MSGYFFVASNAGGLRIQPWIFWPSKLVYHISSGSFIVSWPKSASLNVVSFFGAAVEAVSSTCRSPTAVGVERTKAIFCAAASAV